MNTTDRTESGRDQRYIAMGLALTTTYGMALFGIILLLLIALWGQWKPCAIVLAIQVLALAFNMWFSLWAIPRGGVRLEVVRSVVNVSFILVATWAARWALPTWLFLPLLALALDHLGGRVAKMSVLGTCALQDAWAIWNGVSWIYPLVFTALALFCFEISRLKHTVIHDMLSRSERHGRELEQAHTLLRETHEQLMKETRARLEAELELAQAQKLEAVGRLAAGVAHEINTPIQYVSDSVHFLRGAAVDLIGVLEKLQAVSRSVLDGAADPDEARSALEAWEAADLPYLLENQPKAFDCALEGLGRVASIVQSMREFVHPHSNEMEVADFNRAMESTLTIARGEYKYVADLETDLGPLPPVRCRIGDVNQVVLNVVVNAAHAIESAVRGTNRRGRILVKTRQEGTDVVLSIADTGTGILPEIRHKVFDPFFTTKELGRGTGQGLSIARAVVAGHKGQLSFETEVGKGTTFFIRLPMAGDASQLVEDARAA